MAANFLFGDFFGTLWNLSILIRAAFLPALPVYADYGMTAEIQYEDTGAKCYILKTSLISYYMNSPIKLYERCLEFQEITI